VLKWVLWFTWKTAFKCKLLQTSFFLGDKGFILQKLTGKGLFFILAGETIISSKLAAGEQLRVDTGSLVAMTESIDYKINFVGGFKNALFNTQDLFITELTVSATIRLQSFPFARLADRVSRAVNFGNNDR